MDLVSFTERYLRARELSDKYAKSLLSLARQFPGQRTSQLDADRINRWLVDLPVSDLTRANRCRQVKTLWRAAWEEDLAPPVGRLRRFRLRRRPPEALTIEEVGHLLAAADRLVGHFRGSAISRRWYWRSWLMASWDTGLRTGDLRSVERGWLWPGGYLSICQHKTRRTHRVQLRAETVAAIDTLLAGRRTGPIWSWLNRKNFFRRQRELFVAAGVRGSGRWIRRSSASYVDREHPGSGWRHLGHSDERVAIAYYLDANICRPNPTLPPPLPPACG